MAKFKRPFFTLCLCQHTFIIISHLMLAVLDKAIVVPVISRTRLLWMSLFHTHSIYPVYQYSFTKWYRKNKGTTVSAIKLTFNSNKPLTHSIIALSCSFSLYTLYFSGWFLKYFIPLLISFKLLNRKQTFFATALLLIFDLEIIFFRTIFYSFKIAANCNSKKIQNFLISVAKNTVKYL